MTTPIERLLQQGHLSGIDLPEGAATVQSWRGKSSRAAAGAFAVLLGLGVAIEPIAPVNAESAPAVEQGNAGPVAADYRLGIRDKIKVQVYEWRPARDEVYTWTAINQVYTVDPSGSLTLPLIGQLSAAGYTTNELSTLISRRLANKLNLGTVPDTTVEVTEFRPIFVAGHVERAGEFTFNPGMTVLQAVSLGGGIYRNAGSNGLRLEREFLTVAGEYDRQMQERERLMVRKARLEAELAYSDRIAFPADARSERKEKTIQYSSSLMSKEQSVFELRQKAYETQVATLEQLKTFLEQEVETIGKRLEAHQVQIDLLKSELGGIKNLTDKGLATQPRLLALQRNLAQLEGERLRMESDRTRAMQDVSRAKLSRIEFENRRANELTVELQQVEGRLEQVVQEASLSEQLLTETQAQAAGAPLKLVSNDTQNKSGKPEVHYQVIRQVGSQSVEIEATENSQLQPGDTVKVTISVPAMTVSGSPLEVRLGVPQSNQVTPAISPLPPLKTPERAAIEPVSNGSAAQ